MPVDRSDLRTSWLKNSNTGVRLEHKPTKTVVECDLLPGRIANIEKGIYWLACILEREQRLREVKDD